MPDYREIYQDPHHAERYHDLVSREDYLSEEVSRIEERLGFFHRSVNWSLFKHHLDV